MPVMRRCHQVTKSIPSKLLTNLITNHVLGGEDTDDDEDVMQVRDLDAARL